MKTYIDLFASMQNKFLASKKLKNRLIRYWGTETIDDVEVFKEKFVIYPGTDSENVQKVLKTFGLTNEINKQDFGSVAQYYLTFSDSKIGGYSEYEGDVFANKLNQYLVEDEPYTININIADPSDPSKFANWSDTDILTYVDNNYESLVDSSYVEAKGDTLAEETIGIYILLDDGSDFDVEITDARVMPVTQKKTYNGYGDSTYYTSSISLELKVTRLQDVTATSLIVTKMQAENDQLRQKQLNSLANSSYNYGVDDDWNVNEQPVTDSIWYKGQLRVQATDSYYLRRNEFANLISGSLDTGFVKKKVKWWKKALSFVILVVAIWVAGAYGAQIAAAIGVTGGPLVVFAAAMGVISLGLTALQIALVKSGDEGFATAMGNVVQITSLISTVAGIGAMIQNMASKAASAATKMTASSASASAMAKAAYAEVRTSIVEAFSTDVSLKAAEEAAKKGLAEVALEYSMKKIVSAALKVASFAIDQRNKVKAKQLDALRSDIAQASEELEELQDRELHLGLEDIRFYTQPLRTDNAQFEVDYLYEGTKYNILRPSFYPSGLNIIS